MSTTLFFLQGPQERSLSLSFSQVCSLGKQTNNGFITADLGRALDLKSKSFWDPQISSVYGCLRADEKE